MEATKRRTRKPTSEATLAAVRKAGLVAGQKRRIIGSDDILVLDSMRRERDRIAEKYRFASAIETIVGEEAAAPR